MERRFSQRPGGRSAGAGGFVPLAALIALIGAVPSAAVSCPAEAGIHGVVVSPAGRPVAGAAVTMTTMSSSVVTSEDGRFCLHPVSAGMHRLVAYAEGYGLSERDVRLADGELLEIDVRLRAAFGEEMVVTATRTRKRLADVPLHMQTLPRSRIESVAARTLADAVEWTRGVRVESTCQSCNSSQIRLLGLQGPYAQLLVDGQPTLSSLAMVYGIEQLPARLIDSIEVVRGGGSPAYGAGAVAGVINLIPHHPDHTHIEADARSERMRGSAGAVETPSYSLVADWTPGSRRAATFHGQVDRVAPVDVDGDGFSDVSIRDLDAAGARYHEFFFDGSARLAAEVSHMAEFRRGGDRLHLPPEQVDVAEQLDSSRRGASVSWLHTACDRARQLLRRGRRSRRVRLDPQPALDLRLARQPRRRSGHGELRRTGRARPDRRPAAGLRPRDPRDLPERVRLRPGRPPDRRPRDPALWRSGGPA